LSPKVPVRFSVGTIVLAMVWGFDQALLVAVGLYLAGLGFVARAVRASPTPE
jgi:hypothetical protein